MTDDTDITARRIARFLEGDSFAVVGASTNRAKYGNKVLRCYLQHGRTVYPVNPRATRIEGVRCYPNLASLPQRMDGVSIITPPAITETVVRDAIETGVPMLWMQPGAESERAIRDAQRAGIEVIAGGPCILVVMGYREH